MPDNPGERKIKCVQCSYVFCKNCHQGYHEDEDCETEGAFENLTTNQALQATGVLKFEEIKVQVRTHYLFILGLANLCSIKVLNRNVGRSEKSIVY